MGVGDGFDLRMLYAGCAAVEFFSEEMKVGALLKPNVGEKGYTKVSGSFVDGKFVIDGGDPDGPG